MNGTIVAAGKSPWAKWGFVLGFALGGFFDGILLHQVLQWHHFLSLVPGMDDLRLQVLWDGYFHMLMYVIAVVGLWGLWRSRRRTEGDRLGPAGVWRLELGRRRPGPLGHRHPPGAARHR
jgi:uncharacterized membrane protein